MEVSKVEKKRLYIKALDLKLTKEKFGLYGEVTTIYIFWIFTESPHWADSVSQSQCLSVCCCVSDVMPSDAAFLGLSIGPEIT